MSYIVGTLATIVQKVYKVPCVSNTLKPGHVHLPDSFAISTSRNWNKTLLRWRVCGWEAEPVTVNSAKMSVFYSCKR